jgi:hypothetical protein
LTSAYRHKLLNWFCSILLVVALASLNITYHWFTTVPRLLERDIPLDISYLAGPVGGTLVMYAALFPVVLFWHFWDFVQRRTLISDIGATLSKYTIFLVSFGAASVIMLISNLGLFNTNSCDAIKDALHHACVISPPDWLAYSFFLTAGIALFLCVAKAAISIKSRFSKTK